MNHNQIKSIVYNLIKKYETRNPVRLAKELDIIIQIGDLKKISGCYLKIHERDFIYINEKLLDNEKKVLRGLSSWVRSCGPAQRRFLFLLIRQELLWELYRTRSTDICFGTFDTRWSDTLSQRLYKRATFNADRIHPTANCI